MNMGDGAALWSTCPAGPPLGTLGRYLLRNGMAREMKNGLNMTTHQPLALVSHRS